MKGKKITIILFVIAFILLISGGVASFLFSLKEDRALTLERMVVVNDEFDDLELESYSPDMAKVVDYFKDKECINPHAVNPEYLKLTEAEESKL